jgi:hypothetical protein
MRTLLLLIGLAAIPVPLTAQADSLPPIVVTGLRTAVDSGNCRSASEQWTSHWTMQPGHEAAVTETVASCGVLTERLGVIRGYDLIRVLRVTPHIWRVYVLLVCDNGPAYLGLVLYRVNDADWKVTTVNWNTDPDRVIPASVLPPQRP